MQPKTGNKIGNIKVSSGTSIQYTFEVKRRQLKEQEKLRSLFQNTLIQKQIVRQHFYTNKLQTKSYNLGKS